MFRYAPSRVGRGRRAAVDFVVFLGRFFFIFIFFFERTRPAASVRPPLAPFTSKAEESLHKFGREELDA